MLPAMPTSSTPVSIIVVGDVHRHWRPGDRRFLEHGDQVTTLFVGDLGDEDVEIAEEIAKLDIEKAVILGNHDAWASFSGNAPTPALEQITEALGDDHIGYRVREVPEAGISVVGARPYSWGGESLRSAMLYDLLYGVRTMKMSARAIAETARRAQHRDVIVLAHNGPHGLGAESDSMYGKDFGKPGGDWGDRDLENAIDEMVNDYQLRVRCVIAGHMHDKLMHPSGELRQRFCTREGTNYINPAVVPRLRRQEDGTKLSYFLRLWFLDGEMTEMEELWVDERGNLARAEPVGSKAI